MLKTAIMDEKSLTHMKDRAEALLETRGVTIGHAALCARLREAGCTVEGARVRFPQEVLRGAVAKAPRQFTLYAPEEGFDLPFPRPDGGFYTRGNTGACNWRAADGSTRALRLADADEWFTLVNAMEHVDFVALPSVTGGGAPVKGGDLVTLAHALQLSKKHIWVQPYGVENVRGLLSIAAAAAGGSDALRARSPVSFISCSVPLLGIQQMDAEILLRCAAAGVPVQPCSLPTGGANAPVTPQGTALVCCAEVLAQIVILQLLCPGLPVVATPLPFSMDMLTTYTLQSAPETALCRMLCMQFFEEGYGLPAHRHGQPDRGRTEPCRARFPYAYDGAVRRVGARRRGSARNREDHRPADADRGR